ncbi:kallikrein-1E2-like isoform X2 [Rhodnius prolixus]|uniref:kallikrein-1E2-like isoform X2 n=1 Tax=Rhodnius prolixus TaxID=13249 RepID=UPI003D18F2DB
MCLYRNLLLMLSLVAYVSSVMCSESLYRLWEGKEVTIQEFPYTVLIIKLTISGVCTGSLVHVQWVLTSAHCVTDFNNKVPAHLLIVSYGSSEIPLEYNQTTMANCSEVFVHPEYAYQEQYTVAKHDIALIKLRTAIKLSPNVNLINVEKEDWPKTRKARLCTLTGFGLNKINNFTLHTQTFKARHDKTTCLCAYSKWIACLERIEQNGACAGDSGSSVVCDNKVVGVVSGVMHELDCWKFRLSKGSLMPADCAGENRITLFTRVYPHLSWMNQQLKMGASNYIAA